MPDKQAFYAVYYVLVTGIQWKALPRSLGASSTVHDRFQKWIDEGVFVDLWRVCLFIYAYIKGIEWEWQAIDGANTKAPLGRENTGPNPTDRAKKGTKRVLQTDGNGIPLSVVVAPVNRNDFKVTKDVLDNSVIQSRQLHVVRTMNDKFGLSIRFILLGEVISICRVKAALGRTESYHRA